MKLALLKKYVDICGPSEQVSLVVWILNIGAEVQNYEFVK